MANQGVLEKLKLWKSQLDKKLYEKNGFTDMLTTAEKKTGVKREHMVSGQLFVCLCVLCQTGYLRRRLFDTYLLIE